MRKHELNTDYQDHFEYFGNTEFGRIRKKNVEKPYYMIGLFLTPSMKPWNFSMIVVVGSWAIMPK